MRYIELAFVLTLTTVPALASAQSRINTTTPPQPCVEVGANLGIGWWFAGNDLWSVRMTRNHSGVLATEIAVSQQKANQYRPYIPSVRLVSVAARLMQPPNQRRSRGFVTAGLAIGHGMARAVSPVLSAGGQTNWSTRTALRIEVQRYFGTRDPERTSRIMVGVAVGLGSR